MAQHDYVIDNSTGANVRADINNALLAISSNNSGSSAPSNTQPTQFFADTSAGILKLRNTANSGYVNLFTLLAFVNIFLAVFNSIPLVPLDGGRVVLALYEGITGKKIPDKKLYPLAAVVIVIFVFLGITAFYLDITQPIRL